MIHLKASVLTRAQARARFSPVLAILLLILGSLPFASRAGTAQSGRQQRPQQEAKPSTGTGLPGRSADSSQEMRPRRAEQQDDQNPIKLSADLVTVIVSVSDSAGNQMNGLTRDDFAIYEDNKPQDMAGFYPGGQMPLRMAFLFDTSSSIRHRFDFEQRAAAQFLQQVLKPGDQAAIMSVSTDARLEAQLTPNVDQLVSTLARLKPEGATALYNAMAQSAKYLRPAEGRHVMVVLSDGTDTASGISLAQALTEVQKSDTVIYAVHSTGVAPSANVQDLAGEFVLKAMCEDTGGRAFFPPIYEDPKKELRDLEEIYKRIAAEVRAQYVLTYYSKNESRSGNFKAIRVEVRRPGLQARAHRGYYTSKD